MATPAPPLPSRSTNAAPIDQDDFHIDDEPPPAYEATPSVGERPVEYGPSRPFQPAVVQPPPLPNRPPQTSPPPVGNASVNTGVYSPFPPLNPLPHQARPQLEWEYDGYQPAPPHAGSYSHSPAPAPVPSPDPPQPWAPTTTPQHGQPLLRDGQILMFTAGHTPCRKCNDSGWKNYDPSHPCKSCWTKHGKPYAGAVKIALQSTAATLPPGGIPPNSQKPLPRRRVPPPQPLQPHSYSYGPSGSASHGPVPQPWARPAWHPPPQTQRPLVVRPGDPRLGGELCRTCGGDGQIGTGFLGLELETCPVCRGSGRWFGY